MITLRQINQKLAKYNLSISYLDYSKTYRCYCTTLTQNETQLQNMACINSELSAAKRLEDITWLSYFSDITLPLPLMNVIEKGIVGCTVTQSTKRTGKKWLEWVSNNLPEGAEYYYKDEKYTIWDCILCTIHESI